MKTNRIAPFAVLAAALALAACGGGDKEEAQPAPETNVGELTPVENITEVPVEAPPAPRIDNTVSEAPPAPVEMAPDEQTAEDADATGMTARVSRDEGNDSGQPAE